MINYSFVGYDVVDDKIYFKGVPIPGTRELLGGDNLSTSETSDILFNYKDQENELVDSTVVTFLKDLLTDFSITATKLVDFRITTSELGAFFRKEDHPKYVECGDQILRNFLNGLVIYLRGTREKPHFPSEALAKREKKAFNK